MLTPERKREIEDKANALHQKAEQFQMSHATFACGYLLCDIIKAKSEDKLKAIARELHQAFRDGNSSAIERCRQMKGEYEKVPKLHRVYVEYYHPKNSEDARTVRLDDHYLIVIPATLGDRCLPTEGGTYDATAIHELRKVMAHELGHILLHNGEIGEGTLGTNALTEEQHKEAKFFEEMLVELRNKRRRQLIEQKVYIN